MQTEPGVRPLDFMIIGVQKAGTTALAHFLAQHPKIAISNQKEVHLFDGDDGQLSWSNTQLNQFYHPFFAHAAADQLRGEATPIYCYWPEIIPALARYNPELKIVVILRDPVERAISHYQMEYARGNEKLPMWLAFLIEPFRLWRAGNQLNHAHRCHSYMARGRYASQLKKLREHFSDKQILILENNALRHQHSKTLQTLFTFLGVDDVVIPEETVFENSQKTPNGLSYRIINRVLKSRFYKSNKALRDILKAMQIHADWPWLD
jgi:Sulfotransferase domain